MEKISFIIPKNTNNTNNANKYIENYIKIAPNVYKFNTSDINKNDINKNDMIKNDKNDKKIGNNLNSN